VWKALYKGNQSGRKTMASNGTQGVFSRSMGARLTDGVLHRGTGKKWSRKRDTEEGTRTALDREFTRKIRLTRRRGRSQRGVLSVNRSVVGRLSPAAPPHSSCACVLDPSIKMQKASHQENQGSP